MRHHLFIIVVIIISLSGSAYGGDTQGFYIEELNIGSDLEGNADTMSTITWFQGDKIRREEGVSSVTIGRLDKGIFWMISEEEGTYSVIDLETMQQIATLTMAMMGAQLDEKGEIRINDDLYVRTGEKTKINGWTAEKVEMNPKYAGLVQEFILWISSDCGAPPELYSNIMRSVFGEPEGEVQKLFKLWKELNGYPVKTEMTMMGVKRITLTKTIKKIDIPASMFELPEGLTEVENPMKQALERMKER